MRIQRTVAAGAIAACFLSAPAWAGSDKIAIGQKNGDGATDADDANAEKAPTTFDGAAVLRKIALKLPRLKGADPKTIYTAAWTYGTTHNASGAPIDRNTLGLLYDIFDANTPVGGDGYVEGAAIEGSNSVLSLRVLHDWKSDKPTVTIHCKGPDLPGDARGTTLNGNKKNEKTGTSEDQSFFKRAWAQRKNLRLRDSAADLEQAIAASFDKGVFPTPPNSSASVAFHHDQLDHTANTFTMHAALGYDWGVRLLDPPKFDADGGLKAPWDQIAIFPYLTADRIDDASPTKAKDNLTDLAAGFGSVWMHAREGVTWRINVQIQMDTDDHFSASVLYVGWQASIWPTEGSCVTAPWQTPLFQFQCSGNIDIDYAHIFNPGDFAHLNQKEYARGGFDVSGKISAPDLSEAYLSDTGPLAFVYRVLKPLSFSASYKVLEDMTGSGAGLSRFDASIDYKLGASDTSDESGQSTSIGLTYTNGRADRTLEPERYWELQLKTAL